jgi:hypothetical protein
VEFDEGTKSLRFAREAEGLPVQDMARLVDTSITIPQLTMATGMAAEPVRTQTAKTSKRG